MKRDVASSRNPHKHSVGHAGMQMHMLVERRAKKTDPKSRMTPGSIMQNLPLCFEAAVELPQINILHRDTGIDRDTSSHSGTLPNDHEHGLHANRAIGDMRGRQAERH